VIASPKARRHIAGVVAVVALAALASPVPVGATQRPAFSAATPQSELGALKNVKWTANVSARPGAGSWTFISTGVPASNFVAPDYAVPANPLAVSAQGASIISSSSVLRDQHYDYVLPLTPEYSKSVTAANQGPIGVLLDGAAMYNPYEANHATVATADNFIATSGGQTASFIDSCDGHPGPGGQYHYHGLPACLVAYATGGHPTVASVTSLAGSRTAGVNEKSPAAKKPVILGFAFDGYGIYDNVAMSGKTIPVSALDACNGIFSAVPGYPHGIYHYVLENIKGPRSSIGCYHGVVSSAYTQALQGVLSGGNTPPPPSPAARVGQTLPATAQSLAANKGEDDLLRAVLVASGLDNYC
jgi:hypothetical protein